MLSRRSTTPLEQGHLQSLAPKQRAGARQQPSPACPHIAQGAMVWGCGKELDVWVEVIRPTPAGSKGRYVSGLLGTVDGCHCFSQVFMKGLPADE